MFPADIHQLIVSFIDNFTDLMSWRHTCRDTFHEYTASFCCTRMYPFMITPHVNVTEDTNLSLLSRRHYIKSLTITNGRVKNEHICNMINLERLIIQTKNIYLTENAFSRLSNLKTLHCHCHININDATLQRLPNLTDLDCSYCYEITGKALSQMTNLVRLNCLGVPLNMLDDLNLSFIENLTKLEELTINDNIYKYKNELSNLVNLKQLNIPHNRVLHNIIRPDIAKLLPKLEYVECGDYEFTDEHIMYLSNIKSLICGKNSFFTDLSLKNLTKLEIFDIANAHMIVSVSVFKSLVNLTEFHSGRVQFPDIAFINMSNMESLYCDDNTIITDMCLSYMPNLTNLDCGRNKNFTDSGISQLEYLESLECGSNITITDYSLFNLPYLTKLGCGLNRNFRHGLLNIATNLVRLSRVCGMITDTPEYNEFIKIYNKASDEIFRYNRKR